MSFDLIVFYSMAALTLLSALAVVLHRNTVHSSLFLGLCLAGVAGLFASLGADFLFAGQILIYVSGIAVLIMFVVMLLGRASDLHLRQVNNQWLAALLVCGISVFGLWRVASSYPNALPSGQLGPTTKLLGLIMMGNYSVPFELISLVLMASLLGAIFFSHVEKSQ